MQGRKQQTKQLKCGEIQSPIQLKKKIFAGNQDWVIREQIMFQFSWVKYDNGIAMSRKYPKPLQIHQWDQECEVILKAHPIRR